MSLDTLQPLFDWISQHPGWAAAFVFLVACSESLAIIGLFIPGVVLMFGIGTLVALGTLEFWPTFWLSVTGAIAGDGFSFWLGLHFKENLRKLWPFSRYPDLFNKGENFFLRHGGKSILFGRFIGPVRPIIPVTAGMLGMSVWKFFAVNTLSALAWAPAYLLPGIVFGTSIGLATEIASRLALLVVLLLILTWGSFWLTKRLHSFLAPRATALIDGLVIWGRQHKYLGQFTAAIVDPQQPELKGLSILALGLTLFAVFLFSLFQHFSPGPSLARLDSSIYHLLQGLRTPWGDQLMTVVSQLGDGIVHVVLVSIVLIWLLLRRYYLAASHLFAAALFSILITWLLKHTIQLPRPNEMYQGVMGFSFPSAHSVYASSIFGFLSVLIARELQTSWRWLCYAVAMLLIICIAFSRLYLGAHWFSDVSAGLLLGLVWVLVLGVAYRRHVAPAIKPTGLIAIPILVLISFGSWHVVDTYDENVQRYSIHQQPNHSSFEDWINGGWQQLPTFRIDSLGSQTQPFNLQWAGPLDELENHLRTLGWQKPEALTPSNALHWLNSDADLSKTPLLPNVHDGRHASLTLVLIKQKLIIKLWPANLHLTNKNQNIWLGYVGSLIQKQYPLLTIPTIKHDFDTPLQQFKPFVALSNWRLNYRQPEPERHAGWHGEVLLLWSNDKQNN